MPPPCPETPAGRYLGETRAPAARPDRGHPEAYGRPQATFVLPLQEPNSVKRRCPAQRLQLGPFPPPKAELDPILPPALPVRSPVEEWAARGRCRWIKSFLFLYLKLFGAGSGAPLGRLGAGRGRGGFTCPPRGRGRWRLVAGLPGGGLWAGRRG